MMNQKDTDRINALIRETNIKRLAPADIEDKADIARVVLFFEFGIEVPGLDAALEKVAVDILAWNR